MFCSCVDALIHKKRRGNVIKENKDNHSQRRAFFRANYPKSNRLKILNMDVEVVDISQIGLRFCGANQWSILSKIIENDEILEISVLFHDNTVENIKGWITKCYTDIHSKKQHYILMFTKNVPSKKISNEQSYLLRKFPDFSRFLFAKSSQT
jgi:hypothetical protein